MFSPTRTSAISGVKDMLSTAMPSTVTRHSSVAFPQVAYIDTLPTFTAVTSPLCETTAMDESAVLQVISFWSASAGEISACKVHVSSFLIVTSDGVTVMDSAGFPITFTRHTETLPFTLAETEVFPMAMPSTMPSCVTVATAGFEDSHSMR